MLSMSITSIIFDGKDFKKVSNFLKKYKYEYGEYNNFLIIRVINHIIALLGVIIFIWINAKDIFDRLDFANLIVVLTIILITVAIYFSAYIESLFSVVLKRTN